MSARLEAFWGAENGQVVDIADLPASTYTIVFQRIKEGTAQMQYKWKFNQGGGVFPGADYSLPKQVQKRKRAEEMRIEQVRHEIHTHIRIPDVGKDSNE